MRSFLPYSLATVFFACAIGATASPPALGNASSDPEILIASIESKVRELVNQGNAYLGKGDPDSLMLNQPGTFFGNGDTLITNNGWAIDSFEKALRLALLKIGMPFMEEGWQISRYTFSESIPSPLRV